MKLTFLIFQDRFDNLLEMRLSGVAEQEYAMCVPRKANIDKLDNPARLKINHQAGTEPGV